MEIGSILAILSIQIVALVSPGPDFSVVLRNSLSKGRREAVLASIGITVGIFFHLAYSLGGLQWISEAFPPFFQTIRYAGAAYLFYLGAASLLAKPTSFAQQQAQLVARSDWRAFREGLLTNVLNPKATLFFVSVFSQLVEQNVNVVVKGILATLVVVTTLFWFCFLSYALTQPWLRKRMETHQSLMMKACGSALIIFSILMLLS